MQKLLIPLDSFLPCKILLEEWLKLVQNGKIYSIWPKQLGDDVKIWIKEETFDAFKFRPLE